MKSIINLILALFKKKEPIQEVKVEVKPIISFEDYITASGKYPDRLKSPELTDEYKKNAEDLLAKVNALLIDLKIETVKVSSGFRPTAVNAAIKNAAKKSNHLICKACDLLDTDGSLDKLFLENLKLLEKHGLYLEHPDATKGWAHLQSVAPRSGNRTFRP